MNEPLRDRIVQVLTRGESPLRATGVALLVDRFFALPIREVVDLSEVHRIALDALTAENVERMVERHVEPGIDRYGALAKETGETVGGLVPEDSVDEIRSILGNSKLPRAKWAEGIVDPALMRRLFAPVWTHLLVNFAKRMPIPGVGLGGGGTGTGSAVGRGIGGVASRLSKSVQERAEKIVDAGRGVMGGLGAELEKRVQAAARDFGEGAQAVWREALRDRLKSEEGRELVALVRQQILEHVLLTKLSDLHEDVDRVPLADILDAVPAIVEHAVRRPFARKLVAQEIAAFLAVEGDRTLKDLLSELGIFDAVHALVCERGDDLLRNVAGSPAFGEWLDQLLGEA